jgi:hypothetical protein
VRGKVSCNPALPSEFGTTNNTASVPTTASSPTSVTSLTLPTGGSYLAFANPTASVTSTSAAQHVRVGNDGLHWPRRDGLKWPHFASVVCVVDVA